MPHQTGLFVIFGGTGDLATRKLIPAIVRLSAQGFFGPHFPIVGVGRDMDQTDDSYRTLARDAITKAGIDPAEAQAFCADTLYYHAIGQGRPEDYHGLAERLDVIARERGVELNRVFYLALPPAAFGSTVEGLGKAELLKQDRGWTRLVIEKPFGADLESARALNALLYRHVAESQVFRIDHYLGKESVQNLLIFRFANAIFESLWNRDRIEHVQITVAESLGVEDRAGYYDRTGALRDMVQNHVTQLLALVAMEVPAAFDADSIRYEKQKVLQSLKPPHPPDVVLGQYIAGPAAEGQQTAQKGYREERDVPQDSRTETYVAMHLRIDNWRWQGVPFYVRTGKRLAEQRTEIAVTFRPGPVCLFESLGRCLVSSDVLLLTLQPREGFSLFIDVKRPGEPLELVPLPLRFRYEEFFGRLPEAYETLLVEVLQGDQTHFVRADFAEASWKLYDGLLSKPLPIHEYPAGSWGPPEGESLLERNGHVWQRR